MVTVLCGAAGVPLPKGEYLLQNHIFMANWSHEAWSWAVNKHLVINHLVTNTLWRMRLHAQVSQGFDSHRRLTIVWSTQPPDYCLLHTDPWRRPISGGWTSETAPNLSTTTCSAIKLCHKQLEIVNIRLITCLLLWISWSTLAWLLDFYCELVDQYKPDYYCEHQPD